MLSWILLLLCGVAAHARLQALPDLLPCHAWPALDHPPVAAGALLIHELPLLARVPVCSGAARSQWEAARARLWWITDAGLTSNGCRQRSPYH